MQLTQLKADIWQRWIAACAEMEKIAAGKAAAETFVYSKDRCYDLRKYDGKQIKPDSPVFSEPVDGAEYQYGLDKDGNPCYVFYEHKYNKVSWEGYFSFTPEQAIYVEFNMNNRLPVYIQRKQLAEGKEICYQSLHINGGFAADLLQPDPIEIARELEKAQYDFLLVEYYQHEEGRVTSANCLAVSPGIGEHTFKRRYQYSKSGVLESIKDIDEKVAQDEGAGFYSYVRWPEGRTMQDVADEISLLMAEAVVAGLQEADIREPLAFVEIGYRIADSYKPYVQALTATGQQKMQDEKACLMQDVLLWSDKIDIPVSYSSFERLLTAFQEEAMKKHMFEEANAMMYKAAWHLTTQRLFGKIPVSDQFFAYAVDWSMCPQNLTEIMQACGMSDESLAYWGGRGLFMDDEE
ncbi:hypothetical protein [Chitinophaga sp. HK235]|uniref:hypothetical protein n=1 Tax=Chitinophaga sp. HK235 TaxID=2952571 RepID=UPI001BAB1FAA|nr:hypothetical protein [Chitinophaga sp. HK235]